MDDRGLRIIKTVRILTLPILCLIWLCMPFTTKEVRAFSGIVVGEENTASGMESGKTPLDADTQIQLLYEVRETAGGTSEIYISGFMFSGAGLIERTLVLPEQITHKGTTYDVVGVAANAFRNFSYLKSVSFPSSYRSIGSEAFYGCTNLAQGTLNFNSGMQEIHDHAFYGCSSIQSVNIPASVTLIGTGAFANCENLKEINVESGNSNYCSVAGVLFSKNLTQLLQCPAALSFNNSAYGNYVIDNSVRQIYSEAFSGCINLRQITDMGNSLATIGEKAFYGCSNLVELHIPETVTRIGENAFTGCSPSLVIYCMKSSTGAAENYAKSHGITAYVTCTVSFYDDGKLIDTQKILQGQSATAPVIAERTGYTLTWDKDFTNVQQNLSVYAQWKKNYTVTFKDSFSGQVSQVTTYYGGTVKPPTWTRTGYVLGWDKTDYNYVTKDTTVNAVWMVSMTDTPIKEQKPKVGDTRTINNLTYQVTRTTSGDQRVKIVACTKPSLSKVVIPDKITFGGVTFKVTNIGANAFRAMPKLTTLEIGKNVVTIKKTAFYNCSKLKTITIHSKKLGSVDAKAFSKIYAKAKINVPNSYIKKYKTLLLDGGLSTYAKVY
ncbi:MAG: leucine-rich repeat protein [bacterium]|nr:leucine-rich repeat protein [bacterium]